MNHPNCVRLWEVFDHAKTLYLTIDLLKGVVLRVCAYMRAHLRAGGEWLARVVAQGSFSEKEAADVVRLLVLVFGRAWYL